MRERIVTFASENPWTALLWLLAIYLSVFVFYANLISLWGGVIALVMFHFLGKPKRKENV